MLNIKYLISGLIGRYYSQFSLLSFKCKKWKLSSKVETDEEIQKLLSGYDAIVLGSDQIWNSACIKEMGLFYFGIHANPEQIRVVAYAPSFGHDRFDANPEVVNTLAEHMKKIKAISVREVGGLAVLNNVFGIKNAIRVLDPTMLLGTEYYRKLAHIKMDEESDILAYYLLDTSTDKLNAVRQVASELNLKPVNIYIESESNSFLPLINRLKSLKYPSVESWLERLSKAKFVVTDSFHGTVFSILFNRQFITFGNNRRGNSRFNNLLSMFGLEDNLCLSPQDLQVGRLPQVEYAPVNNRLKELRKQSLKFIEDSLK